MNQEDNKIILAHKIALDPNAKQLSAIRQAAGVARFVYNWALEEWERQYEAGEKPNAPALDRKFNSIKRDECPFVTEVTKCAAQVAIKNLGVAFANFFRKVKAGHKKPGYPRFKKRGRRDSFGIANDAFRFDGKRVRISRIGWVKYREALRFKGKIIGATICREADRWFISVQVEIEDKQTKHKKKNKAIGIDLGLTTFATIYDGETIEKIKPPKPLKKNLKKLKRANKALSRCEKDSKNREKAKREVARVHQDIANTRKDFLHKLSHRLTRTTWAVVIEDLDVKGMLKNKKLARHISDVSWSEFVRQLSYKSVLYDSQLAKVDRWFPSSKMCFQCQAVKESLELYEREFICDECGYVSDRDENAAKNIYRAGLAQIQACGPDGSGQSCKILTKPAGVKQEL